MKKKQALFAAGISAVPVFFLECVLMLRLNEVHTGVQAAGLALLFTLPYAAAILIFAVLEKPDRGQLLFTGIFAVLALAARTLMLDFMTGDYYHFLEPWVQVFREGGFSTLAQNVGDYNLIYQYFLLIVAKIPLYSLYLIKWFTVIFDFALALVMMCAAESFASRKAGIPVFCLTLLLPTVLTDGACWGQCDSVYVFFVVLSLYALHTDRPCLSAGSLAIAFAFKLQTIFFFPVVLLGLLHRKFKLRHAAVFFAAYLVTMIPALAAGRSFMDALSVYANQSMGQYYDRLTYNAPNLYLFFPMLEFATAQEFTWMRYIQGVDSEGTNEFLSEFLMPDLQSAVLLACIVLVIIAVAYWLIHWKEVTMDSVLELALFFAVFLPFVMPKIHERYFFLADMLSVLYAARYRNRRFLPLLVVGSSYLSYVSYLMRQRPVDERWLALAMLAALLIISRDLLHTMRANRAQRKEAAA